REIKWPKEIPESKVRLFDTTLHQILNIAGDEIPDSFRKQLEGFEYGPGIFKMDIAIDGPIPWKDKRCLKAGTVHLGGTFDAIARSEKMIEQGKHPKKPFVLLAQQSLFDPGRAPEGKHTVWAYCHVPSGSTRDMSELIIDQIE